MQLLASIRTENTCDVRMTSDHVFLKQNEKKRNDKDGWLVVSLKESLLSKTLTGNFRVKESPKVNKISTEENMIILYDHIIDPKMLYKHTKFCIGIYAD
jgi:hypothetical protein